ncbi:Estrogen-related receptor [Nesidiocoris tenuis]|uniref:Estrogen-related receptor n=1 Tax=Nesidiocoris tenuis TaxID=355587 RepID=A0ABN7AEQ6_9HEMI|nr:Estrogen-related receptor [Nesidiocoris tenuis]
MPHRMSGDLGMNDSAMLGPIKEEEEVDLLIPMTPLSTIYSPPPSHLHNEVNFSESSSYGELAQGSPESPDHQFCSSTTTVLHEAHTSAGDAKDESGPRRFCLVCGDTASGFHYGVASCEACKAFFKRTIQGNIEYNCPANNDCEINKRRRKACQACRFQKCLEKGMLKEGVRLDRVRGGRQKYRRNNEVPYTISYVPHSKSSLEDNKMLEILLGCEPEILSIAPKDGTAVSPLGLLSDLYDKELVNIIGWAKQIPGFTDLSLTNQMRLLQSTWTEILTLSLAYRSLPPCGKLRFAVDFIFDESLAHECGAMELYQLGLVITNRLHVTDIRKEEYILLKALVLANSDVRLDEALALKQFRESIVSALTDCVAIIRGNSADTTSLLLCLPILRQVDHTLRSFWVNIHRRGTIAMNKLFIEMLEPPLKS